jgi:hypothetical protein
MIGSILEPDSFHLLSRVLNYSSSRVKVLLKPINSGRLYVTDGRAFIHDKPTPRPAKSHEIEFIVGKNITRQFGDRFEETLDGVARQSVLLAKVPEAIPLLLRTRPMFTFVSPKQLSAHRIPPASQRGREFSDELDDLAERAKKVSPFGVSGGTCTFVQDYVMKAREQDHYMRFLAVRADASSDASSRLQSETLNSQSLLVVPGGAVMLAEGGPVVTRATLYSLKVPKGFDGKELALLAWIKSAFFIWYCSVYLGEPDLFMLLFNASVRFPIPTMQGNEEFFARLEINTKNLILEERHFLDDVARMTRKDPGSSEIEKLRNRHNKAANAYALAIDKEVSAFLKLEEDEQIFIAETLLNLKMTDFGLIDELQQIEAAKEAKVEV